MPETTGRVRRLVVASVSLLTGGAGLYALVVRGAVTVDVGWGRRTRPLGPIRVGIDAPRETVFDVISEPYLQRTPRALHDKLKVIERGSDMVLAAHFTRVRGLVVTTLETVRFRHPEQVDFRLVRGPVPHVVERFVLTDREGSTELLYDGELGTDFWKLGQVWGDRVATKWEAVVRGSLDQIRREAERRTTAAPAKLPPGSDGP